MTNDQNGYFGNFGILANGQNGHFWLARGLISSLAHFVYFWNFRRKFQNDQNDHFFFWNFDQNQNDQKLVKWPKLVILIKWLWRVILVRDQFVGLNCSFFWVLWDLLWKSQNWSKWSFLVFWPIWSKWPFGRNDPDGSFWSEVNLLASLAILRHFEIFWRNF